MTALGYCDKDGKLRNDMIRKYNQTNHILSLVSDLFDGKNDITVVDCACGKILSFLCFELLSLGRKTNSRSLCRD